MSKTSMDTALAAIRKQDAALYKKARVDVRGDERQAIPAVSSGSIVLNHLIGGTALEDGSWICPGYPRSRITEVFGGESSGKSTLALHACAEALKAGGSAAYIDFEHTFAHTYASNVGIDLESPSFSLWQPMTWEEGCRILVEMVLANVDLVVIDSVSAMTPKALLEVKLGDNPPVGLLARLQSAFLQKFVTNQLSISSSAVIYINQVRANIKTSQYDHGPDEETTGGRALKFYASLRLKLARVKSEKAKITNRLTGQRDEMEVCNVVSIQGIKNKLDARQHHKAQINIRYGEGIDNVRSILDIAIMNGVVIKNGGWYTYEGTSDELSIGDGHPTGKRNGIEVLRACVISKPAIFQDIQSRLVANLSGGSEKVDTSEVADADLIVEDHEREPQSATAEDTSGGDQ